MRLIVQRLMLAVALVAAAIMFVPAPAQADGPRIEICISPGIYPCPSFEIPILEPHDDWPPGCEECFAFLDFMKYKIDPAILNAFAEQFGKGLAIFAESHLTEDPEAAEQLRQMSVEYFRSAAKAIQNETVELDIVGWFNPDTGKFHDDPKTQPLLETLGKELAAGTQLFQKALGDPDPEPDLEAALAHYDTAIEALNKTTTA
jgi:hypothetical protein